VEDKAQIRRTRNAIAWSET